MILTVTLLFEKRPFCFHSVHEFHVMIASGAESIKFLTSIWVTTDFDGSFRG